MPIVVLLLVSTAVVILSKVTQNSTQTVSHVIYNILFLESKWHEEVSPEHQNI